MFNRTLQRPMFRIGGSAGTGITSGLDTPRKRYAFGSTGDQREYLENKNSVNSVNTDKSDRLRSEIEVLRSIQGDIPKREPYPYKASDFFMGLGSGILAQPGGQPIFQTIGKAAQGPIDQLSKTQMASWGQGQDDKIRQWKSDRDLLLTAYKNTSQEEKDKLWATAKGYHLNKGINPETGEPFKTPQEAYNLLLKEKFTMFRKDQSPEETEREDIIRKEWQQPTLFLSLELSGWYMHRRNLQIVSGMDKEQVTRNHSYVGTTFGDNLGHINIQTVSANVETIQKQIKNLQPNVVVIDYIDLLETPKHIRGGEYEQIRYISHFLSNLAVNSDIIIIQISQVSREYSRNEILDIYAGKGSGAIENASRKVIGINGKQNEADKTVSLFKNSDGDLFDVELEWKPSFRLPVKGVSDENTHHQSRSET